MFDEVISRHRFDGIEVDLYLPSINLAVEYDGSFFHRDREIKDLKKNNFIQSRNISIIRVRHHPLKQTSENDVIVKSDDLSKSDMDEIFRKIRPFIQIDTSRKIDKYLKMERFSNDETFRDYISFFPNPLPEHSLLHTHPDLSKEWDYKNNSPLRPENFSYGSNDKVWWVCSEGHKYDAIITNRTRDPKPSGCPVCDGKRVGANNNLLIRFPKITSEWHPTKNGNTKPQDVMPGNNKKFWWLCPNCDEDYDMAIVSRTHKTSPQKCPTAMGGELGRKIIWLSYYLT